MRVFITGSTGLIGRELGRALRLAGHEVTGLSRSRDREGSPPDIRMVQGDPAVAGPWLEALAVCEACVHLAGEPVAAGRWTAVHKRRIRESRVASTRLVAETIAKGGPAVLVSGSAVGFYGNRGDEPLTEASAAGDGFLAEVCTEWEAATSAAATRARVVLLRTGIVLARQGGALPRMLVPFRFFAAGPIGKGDFWQPWIHLADEVAMIRWALENAAVSGPLNAVAPNPVRQGELAAAIGRALHRPSAIPVPPVALRLALGELAEVVTASQRVLPVKALDLGYRFRFPEIGPALEDLIAAR